MLELVLRAAGSKVASGPTNSNRGKCTLNSPESQLERTAYHEAGHAVVAFALGGVVESVQLGGEEDDWLPARFGDCRVNWGAVAAGQRERELMTVLAGPVAEQLYSNAPVELSDLRAWQADWITALQISGTLASDEASQYRLLRKTVTALKARLDEEPFWSAIAAVADELLAHEFLDEEALRETLTFWLERN